MRTQRWEEKKENFCQSFPIGTIFKALNCANKSEEKNHPTFRDLLLHGTGTAQMTSNQKVSTNTSPTKLFCHQEFGASMMVDSYHGHLGGRKIVHMEGQHRTAEQFVWKRMRLLCKAVLANELLFFVQLQLTTFVKEVSEKFKYCKQIINPNNLFMSCYLVPSSYSQMIFCC